MAWKEDIAPNTDDNSLVVYFGVIGQGNPLSDWYGDCAAVVRNAYHIANPLGSSAWDIYVNHNKLNHNDRNWPVGVHFPIWFSGYGGLGHVAIAYWNGTDMQIWTSPYTHKPFFDHYTNVDRLAAGYGVSYAGWSEDFAGTRVIEYVPDAPQHPYTVETIAAKQVVAPNGATEWNLDDTTWSQFNTNPVGRIAAGNPVTVTALAHHKLGGTYYMPDGNVAQGYNTADMQDYAPPAPTPEPAPAPAPEPTPTPTPEPQPTPPAADTPTQTPVETNKPPTVDNGSTSGTTLPIVVSTPSHSGWWTRILQLLKGLFS